MVEGRKSGYLAWPVSIFGPAPGQREINLACWGLFAGLLITNFCFPLWVQFRTGSGPLHLLPADFIYFYSIGHIANSYPLTRLYDYKLQLATFNSLYEVHDGAYGPSPYPPFVALFFGLFARMSFLWAFFLWAFVSLFLYMAGIALVLKGAFPGAKLKGSLIFCFALAFCPFLHNTLANGQIATVAVFAVGLAISLECRSKPLLSGLALSILAYKPTLLLLILPMLLLTRRYRQLSGFVLGLGLLVLVSTLFGGVEIWPAYASFLIFFGKQAGINGQSVLLLRQYVDLKTFLQAVSSGKSTTEWISFVLLAIAVAITLGVLLWKSGRKGRVVQYLAWATTLTWTLLLNVYVPVYDSILISIAAVLTLAALNELGWSEASTWCSLLFVVIGAASWGLDVIAFKSGIQFLSILLAGLGIAQLFFLYRVQSEKSESLA